MAEQVQKAGAAHGAGSPFRIFKPGQGKWVRWGTAAGVTALAIAGAGFLREQIRQFAFADNVYVLALAPVAFLLVIAYLTYWALGRNETIVNFMIATEGEMKKVNWSSRREVWGATKVVIVAVLALSFVLFVVDIIFMIFFSSIGVLRMDIVERFFGSGA